MLGRIFSGGGDKTDSASTSAAANSSEDHQGTGAPGGVVDNLRQNLSDFKDKAGGVSSAAIRKLKEEMEVRYGEKIALVKAQSEAVTTRLRQELEVKERALKSRAKEFETKVWDKVDARVEKILDHKVLPFLQTSTVDPDMPGPLRRLLRDSVGLAWPDVKEELWNMYKDLMMSYEDGEEGTFPSVCPNPFAALRAFILYHTSPYNRTFWRQTKEPWWWVFKLISLCPVFAVSPIWFALLTLMMDKGDEHQLVSFILGLKGTMYITIGLIGAFQGVIQYYFCVSYNKTTNCNVSGPGQIPSYYVDLVAFAAQILLVWIAFLLLPYSEKKGVRAVKPGSKGRRIARAVELPLDTPKCCGRIAYGGRGGRLRHMLLYDTLLVFLMIIFVLSALFHRNYAVTDADDFSEWEWQFRTDLYWIKTLYGLLSFPFFVFTLPGVAPFLLHTRPTGYSRSGQCVPEDMPDSEAKRARELELRPANAELPVAVAAVPHNTAVLEIAEVEEEEKHQHLLRGQDMVDTTGAKRTSSMSVPPLPGAVQED